MDQNCSSSKLSNAFTAALPVPVPVPPSQHTQAGGAGRELDPHAVTAAVDTGTATAAVRRVNVNGTLIRASNILSFRTGKAVFLQLLADCEVHGDNGIEHRTEPAATPLELFVIVQSKHLMMAKCLELRARYSLTSLTKCYWKDASQSTTCNQVWFNLTEESKVFKTEQPRISSFDHYNAFTFYEILPTNSQSSLDSDVNQLLATFSSPSSIHAIDCTTMMVQYKRFVTLLKPCNLRIRERLSCIEVNIKVKVHQCHEDGWLEIEPSALKLHIYMSHYRWANDHRHLSFAAGSVLIFCSVLPVYLWGRLSGFACTIRTSIMDGQSHTADVRISSDGYRAVDGSPKQIQQRRSAHNHFDVPPDLAATSNIYAAWKCQVSKKLYPITKSDRSLLQRVIDCIARQPQASNKSMDTSAENKSSGNLLELCKLPVRSVQYEFSSIHHLQLIMVRSGHDADWISSHLPKVVAPTEVLAQCNKETTLLNGNEGLPTIHNIFSTEIKHYFDHYDFLYRSIYVVGRLEKYQFCSFFESHAVALCTVTDRSRVQPACESLHVFITGTCHQLRELFGCKFGDGRRVQADIDEEDSTIVCIRNPRLIYNRAVDIGSIVNVGVKRGSSRNSQYTPFGTCLLTSSTQVNILTTVMNGSRNTKGYKRSLDSSHTIDLESINLRQYATESILPSNAAVNQYQTRKPPCFHSVRHILHHSTPKADGLDVTVCGVIVSKDTTMGDGQRQQCTITLRDLDYADTISIYMPAELSFDAIVGSIVLLQKCHIATGANKKHVHGKIAVLDFHSIGIVGFPDDNELSCITPWQINKRASANSQAVGALSATNYWLHDELNVLPPPRIYLSELSGGAMQVDDYCCWTVHVRILAVKTLTVALKCVKCHSGFDRSPTSPIGFRCNKCQRSDSLVPQWSAVLICEDGSSGSSFVDCEGDVLMQALRELAPGPSSDLTDSISRIETRAQAHGYLKYDSFFASQRSGLGGHQHHSAMGHLDDGDIPWFMAATRGANEGYQCLNNPIAANDMSKMDDMTNMFDLWDFSSIYELVVKVVHKKSPSNDHAKEAVVASQRKVSVKSIKAQEWDSNYAYAKSTTSVSTYCFDPLFLDCLKVKRIAGYDLRNAIYEGLCSNADST